jgi:hypothetical protein
VTGVVGSVFTPSVAAESVLDESAPLASTPGTEAGADAARPAARIAAISELLRRAARRVDAKADHLEGEAWLGFLDGQKSHHFTEGAGRLLLEGGYRRDVPAAEFAAASALARARFLELMAGRK